MTRIVIPLQRLLFAHDLLGKHVATFSDHASRPDRRGMCATFEGLPTDAELGRRIVAVDKSVHVPASFEQSSAMQEVITALIGSTRVSLTSSFISSE
jgi:hypothetical protein